MVYSQCTEDSDEQMWSDKQILQEHQQNHEPHPVTNSEFMPAAVYEKRFRPQILLDRIQK